MILSVNELVWRKELLRRGLKFLPWLRAHFASAVRVPSAAGQSAGWKTGTLHSMPEDGRPAHDQLQQVKLDQSWQRYHDDWPDVRDRYDVVVALVRGPILLDVGCGQGLLLHLLSQRRPDVTRRVGLDNWPVMLDEAGDQLSGDFELWLEDAERNPGVDGEFDTVVLGQILEHAYDVQAVADEALRVLRPGGRLIVNVPADDAEPHGNHVRVFRSAEEVMALFKGDVKWSGWGRLHRFWHAWGERA